MLVRHGKLGTVELVGELEEDQSELAFDTIMSDTACGLSFLTGSGLCCTEIIELT